MIKKLIERKSVLEEEKYTKYIHPLNNNVSLLRKLCVSRGLKITSQIERKLLHGENAFKL